MRNEFREEDGINKMKWSTGSLETPDAVSGVRENLNTD